MKSKLLWLFAVLLAAAAWLFENNAGTLTMLSCAVLLPILGMVPLLLRPKLTACWEMPAPPEKGAQTAAVLAVRNEGSLFLPRLELQVNCRNLRTGEEKTQTVRFSLLPKQEKRLTFRLSCTHCGRIEMRVASAMQRDLFGLFSKTTALDAKGELTVLPDLFHAEVSLQEHDMATPDSDTYSATKPGSDPGETFAIREYIPGDAIRKIHWKLSEKTDKLMTREFGLPVVNEVLLLLETSCAESADETDAITEVFASICQSLSERGILHHTAWRANESDALTMRTVTAPGDFAAVLSDILELSPKENGSVAQRFTEQIGHCSYAHVIVVGGQIPEGIRDLYNGNRISVLLPHRNGIYEGLQPDGTYVLSFEVDGYAAQLCRLEV